MENEKCKMLKSHISHFPFRHLVRASHPHSQMSESWPEQSRNRVDQARDGGRLDGGGSPAPRREIGVAAVPLADGAIWQSSHAGIGWLGGHAVRQDRDVAAEMYHRRHRRKVSKPSAATFKVRVFKPQRVVMERKRVATGRPGIAIHRPEFVRRSFTKDCQCLIGRLAQLRIFHVTQRRHFDRLANFDRVDRIESEFGHHVVAWS